MSGVRKMGNLYIISSELPAWDELRDPAVN